MRRHTFKLMNPRTRKQEGILSFFGSSYKKAERKARKFARDHRMGFASGRKRKGNVEQGFYDAMGFHPIRRSRDYDRDRVGELYQYGRGGTERSRPRKRKKSRRSRR